jgi:hypothetical protein
VGILFGHHAAAAHAGTGRHPGDVHVVLQGHGHPVEAPDDAVPPAPVGGGRLLLDQGHAEVDIGIQRGIQALDRVLVDVAERLGLYPPDGEPVQDLQQGGAA